MSENIRMPAYRFMSRYFRNNHNDRIYNKKWFVVEILQITDKHLIIGEMPVGYWFTEFGDFTELDEAAVKIYLKMLFPGTPKEDIDSALVNKQNIFKINNSNYRFRIYEFTELDIEDSEFKLITHLQSNLDEDEWLDMMRHQVDNWFVNKTRLL